MKNFERILWVSVVITILIYVSIINNTNVEIINRSQELQSVSDKLIHSQDGIIKQQEKIIEMTCQECKI